MVKEYNILKRLLDRNWEHSFHPELGRYFPPEWDFVAYCSGLLQDVADPAFFTEVRKLAKMVHKNNPGEWQQIANEMRQLLLERKQKIEPAVLMHGVDEPPVTLHDVIREVRRFFDGLMFRV